MLVIVVVAPILSRRALCHADATSRPLIAFVGCSAARMHAAGRLAAPVILVAMLAAVTGPKIRLSHQQLQVIAVVDCALIATGGGADVHVAAGIRAIMRSLPDALHGIASSGTTRVRWTAPASLTEARAVVGERCGSDTGTPGPALGELTLLDSLRQFDDWGVRRAMILLLDPTTRLRNLEQAVAEVRRLKVVVVVVQVGGHWRNELWPLLSAGVSSYVPPRLNLAPSLMGEAGDAIGAHSLDVYQPLILLTLVMMMLMGMYEGSLVHLEVGAIRSLVVRSLLVLRLGSITISDRRGTLPSQ